MAGIAKRRLQSGGCVRSNGSNVISPNTRPSQDAEEGGSPRKGLAWKSIAGASVRRCPTRPPGCKQCYTQNMKNVVQGYFAPKKQHPPRTLQLDYAGGLTVVLGGGQFLISEVPLYRSHAHADPSTCFCLIRVD